MREITFTTPQIMQITDAEFDLIHTMYNMEEPRKVTAVKFLKNQYNISLRQAKDVCDTIGNIKM